MLWWSVVGGRIGGRVYFVVQQPNLVSYYLAQPWHILATWEGGMAFFGAIFFVVPVIFWRARVERINPLVPLVAGGFFSPPPHPSRATPTTLTCQSFSL